MNKHASLVERFWANIDRRSDSECWPWLGTHVGAHGITEQRKADTDYAPERPLGSLYAHRLAFEFSTGKPIPPGMFVLHSRECVRGDCTNPKHLRLGNQTDNMRDAAILGRLGNGGKRRQIAT